jgi:hypothetical protein
MLLAVAAALLIATSAAAAPVAQDPLYSMTVLVTGEREETRNPGIETCFRDALVRVSGDPRLDGHPRLAELATRARAHVWSYTYHDRYFGKPLADEQGTRDRPFDLTVQFDKPMMDAALAALGSKPWPGPRPTVLLLIGVRNPAGVEFMLASDAELGSLHREAFGDASYRHALPIRFPTVGQLRAAGVDYAALGAAGITASAELLHMAGADIALSGLLDWSEADAGWIANWTLHARDGSVRWQVRGVNFDAAYRNALAGAAQVLSGNGAPR